MFTHDLDPILIDFGFIAIRWYSLAYIFGIILGWWYGKKIIIKYFNSETVEINLKNFDDLITNLIFSIIIGGRLGYVIFYNPKYYISNPLDIIKIWEGGMSFHGALIGVIIGTYFFSKKRCWECCFYWVILLTLPDVHNTSLALEFAARYFFDLVGVTRGKTLQKNLLTGFLPNRGCLTLSTP